MQFDQSFASRNTRMKASEIRELLKLLDQPDIISFAGGIPDPALFPADEFADAFKNALTPERQAMALQYSVSEGYLPLRDWIVEVMAKIGIACDANNVLITSGSQQALDYLGKLFLSPGDTALVGWPTYLGALAAFNAYEPRYDRLSLKGNRTAESYAEDAADAGSAVKFAYLSPDFANPTGETLDLAGRLRLLELADSLECAVIEDAAYQSLRYDGEVVPPVLALELERKGSIEDCRTIYCGSFSKTLSPGLRIGWAVAAKPVITQMVLLKQAADLHSSTINQMAVHGVAEARFDVHVAQLHAVYQRRRDVMLAALAEHMPEGVSWTRPEGGMFVWMTLPDRMDGAQLLARSLETERVAFVPGQAFFADGSGQNTIRLSFSNSNHTAIEDGIARLGRLLGYV
ncbi:PLP-dependent aminotransferase family protein [Leisingera sp. HS039]|uniref:aminotransferase-like domain-containing protein n=1 Tax=unclassified Leisingera TaxID=2614906 RepID=UPI001070B121|nr:MULTISPECIES: PLP-dependent aminotransferase family protein [unclassified Leisingera]MBQ4825412.1 PLP-dependent aminotransferase family protein [Leisingera sp. HS039]QBR37768.1 PLP-dependent aminotransferase family protein [Leisingera sp. NJS201]